MLSIFLVNQLLALGTIFAQVVIIIIIIAFLTHKTVFSKLVLGFLSKKAMILAFLTSFLGIAGSLYYSEFIGFEPCKLCWYQRIFLYPQAILLAIGLIKKHSHIANYCILFSFFGALLAGYQSLTQAELASGTVCLASGISCNQIFVMQFGFITIPIMALTAFLLIIVLLLAAKAGNKD